MAWYLIVLNLFFATLVFCGIVGLHVRAIVTQHRDRPDRQQRPPVRQQRIDTAQLPSDEEPAEAQTVLL